MRRALHMAGSWWTTALLACAIAGLYVYHAFGDAAYAAWTRALFNDPLWIGAYATLIINLALKSALLLHLRFRPTEPTLASVQAMQEHAELPLSAWEAMEKKWFLEHGMRPVVTGDAMVARRGEWSVLAGTILRLGVVMVMVALPMSMGMREQHDAPLVQAAPSAEIFGKAVSLRSVRADLPESFIQVGEKSIFRLEELAVRVALDGAEHEITAGYPESIGGLYWRVAELGYAARTGEGDEESMLMLDVLPPGRQDVRQIGERTLRLSLAPEREIRKGLVTGMVYNLQRPSIRVELKGADGVYGKPITLAPGAASEGLTISDTAHYVRLVAVRDPALALLVAGVWTCLLGLALMFSRLFWYERRMCAVRCADGVLLGYSEEFYPKWAIHKFRRWIDESTSML